MTIITIRLSGRAHDPNIAEIAAGLIVKLLVQVCHMAEHEVSVTTHVHRKEVMD